MPAPPMEKDVYMPMTAIPTMKPKKRKAARTGIIAGACGFAAQHTVSTRGPWIETGAHTVAR